MTHPATVYSLSTRLLHWSMAFCFIGAIVLAYFVIWVLGHDHPQRLPVLNLHWVLGLLVGLLLIPRIVSRLRGPRLPAVPGTPLEHRLAHYAHLSLYALMLVMPLTGYVGTRLPTDFGLFVVPSFKDTALFAWISQTWNLNWEAFEKPFDAVHRVVGLWLSTSVVLLHALAAGYHQWVRRDSTLERMLGRRQRR
ncbi:TPA: cytochrome b [Pseudomonas aeruginosa]|nr:cytochrome b [Pseudomonas aeruginosa]